MDRKPIFDVVGIGLNAIDCLVSLPRFPVPGEKLRMSGFAREGGGQAATALVALSRWGCRCKYVGNVGDDEHGRLSSLLLSKEGVDLAHVRTVPDASSQFAVILVEEITGERTILWDRDPKIRVSQEDLPIDDIRQARALLLDGHDVPPAITAARTARAAGVPVVLDAEKVQEGTEELLSLCDHIVAAGHFPGLLFPGITPEDGAREILRRYGSRTATVTLGPRGAFGCDGREEILSPSVRVEAVDTTGAGDIFHAGFLYALLEGLPFREILAFANTAAGLSCRGMGGRAAIPTIEAVRLRIRCEKGGGMTHKPAREEAWTILTDHVKTPSLLAHALAVEAVMRHVARKKGADEETWGAIGLVHDVDYEEHPEEHLRHAPEILRSHGWPGEYVRAVASHGWGLFTDDEPVTDLEKTLFAIDELTGLVAAAALVRPSRSVLDLPVKSVLKKWKDKAFAAGVDRKVIEKGAALMGVPLEELVADTIEGMKTVAEAIGLKGNLGGSSA